MTKLKMKTEATVDTIIDSDVAKPYARSISFQTLKNAGAKHRENMDF